MNQVLRLECVTKRVENTTIIENMNLSVKKGTVVGVVGKTHEHAFLFMQLLSGEVMPCSGDIYYGKYELGKYGQVPQSVGVYTSPIGFLTEFTGFKNLKYIAGMNEIAQEQDILEAMDTVGLSSNNRKRVQYYSRRMIHRLSIAQAIMEGQQVLLLDADVFSSQEKENHKEISKIIKRLQKMGVTIIVASEKEEYLVDFCDQVIYV